MNEAKHLLKKLKPHRGRKYPNQLRLEVGNYIVNCRDAGQNWFEIQKKLEIGNVRVKNWYAKSRAKKRKSVQPVKLKPTVSCASEILSMVRVVSPEG